MPGQEDIEVTCDLITGKCYSFNYFFLVSLSLAYSEVVVSHVFVFLMVLFIFFF